MDEQLAFRELDTFERFEVFLCALLNRGVSIRKVLQDDRVIDLTLRDRVQRYGGKGDDQRGIDLVGVLVDGSQVVFQCKYHSGTKRSGKPETSRAIKDAQRRFPEAKHYYLVTNTRFTPAAGDALREACWGMWGGADLLDKVRELPKEVGYALMCEHFGTPYADEMFPSGPDLLQTVSDYRQSFGDGPLAHKYGCVGREAEIKQLESALLGKEPTAVILSGEGGLGKSCLFCEVLERVSRGETVRVMQADAAEASVKEVSLLEGKRVIIGMDECHLEGYFRKDVSAALKDHFPDGRLLLACRPEGLPALRDKLGLQGWEIEEPLGAEGLKPLNRAAMYRLAEAVVGDNIHVAEDLVAISDGVALITVVGGEMLRDSGEQVGRIVNSASFRKKIFQRLEDSFLGSVANETLEAAKRLLRLLAILSPWSEDDLTGIGEFLGLGPFELDDKLTKLRRAGLVRGEKKRMRVIPDLLADYLCYDVLAQKEDLGLLSRLRGSSLLQSGAGGIFRNLAMARWCGNDKAAHLDELIDGLWSGFIDRYRNGDDPTRERLVGSWEPSALFLPEKSLELCQEIFASTPRPDKGWLEVARPSSEFTAFRHERMQQAAVRMLSHIARFDQDHQAAALDLLWEHREKEAPHHNSRTPGEVAAIFGPERRRSVRLAESALEWLLAKLDRDELSHWTSERTREPTEMLSPAFRLFIETATNIGDRMVPSAQMLKLDATDKIRGLAFTIVDKLINASRFGALNCLDLLRGVAWPARPPFRAEMPVEAAGRWEMVRMRAMGCFQQISKRYDEPTLAFLLGSSVKRLAGLKDQSDDFVGVCDRVLVTLPNTLEYRLRVVVLSNYWEETGLRGDDGGVAWRKTCELIARDLLNALGNVVADVPPYLDELGNALKGEGLRPDFWSIIHALISVQPAAAGFLRGHLLATEDCAFANNFSQITRLLDNVSLDAALAEGLDVDRPALFHNICGTLQREEDLGRFPLTVRKLEAECRRASGAALQTILNEIQGGWGEHVLDAVLLRNLPWEKLGAAEMVFLNDKCFDPYEPTREYPLEGVPGFLGRLNEFPLDFVWKVSAIVTQVCRKTPAEAFAFFEERMEMAKGWTGDGVPPVFPSGSFSALSFGDVNSIPDYSKRAAGIVSALRKDPGNDLLSQWFELAVLDSGDAGLGILLDWLDDEISETEYRTIVKLVRRANAGYPLNTGEVVRKVLKRGELISRQVAEDAENKLFYSVVNHAQSYENGVPEDLVVLNKAREQREKYASDPLLLRFYDRIVQHEEEDARKHREEHERDSEARRRFQ